MAEMGTQPACTGGQCGVFLDTDSCGEQTCDCLQHGKETWRKSLQDEEDYMVLGARLQILSAKHLFQIPSSSPHAFLEHQQQARHRVGTEEQRLNKSDQLRWRRQLINHKCKKDCYYW